MWVSPCDAGTVALFRVRSTEPVAGLGPFG